MPDLICDMRKVPHHHRVQMLTDLHRRRIADDHLELLLLDAMAADPEPYPGDEIACEKEYVREEVAAIARIAPVTAGHRLHVAERMCARFPQVVDAMGEGLLPGYFATRLVELTDQLTDAQTAEVEKRILPRIGQQTLGQLTTTVKRAVLAVDPRDAEEKHERSREDRRVHFGAPGPDGMVELWALLPTVPPPRTLTVVVSTQHHPRNAVAITSQRQSAPTPSAHSEPTPRRSPRPCTSGSRCPPC